MWIAGNTPSIGSPDPRKNRQPSRRDGNRISTGPPWAQLGVWALGFVLLLPITAAAAAVTASEPTGPTGPAWQAPIELDPDLFVTTGTTAVQIEGPFRVLAGGSITGSGPACDLHPGILITEDEGTQGFEWRHPLSGMHEPRPGSGVTGGQGTQEDPYIIEGWCIAATGIEITGTSAHVVVRDNVLIGPGLLANSVGILIQEASHVRIEANQVTGFGYGVGVWRSDDVDISQNVVKGNLLYGIWTAEVPQVTMQANIAQANENGLGVGLSHGALVTDNLVEDNTIGGIVNVFSDDAMIRDNHLAGNDLGIYVREAFDVAVTNNTIDEHTGNAVAFDQSPRGLAQGNLVTQSGHEGIIFWSSPEGHALGNTATGNGFADNRYGIRMANSIQSTATGNMVTHNANGIAFDDSPTSMIRGNLLADNEESGLILWNAEETEVVKNSITRNGIGVLVVQNTEGLLIYENNLWDNDWGTGLNAHEAPGDVDVSGNWWGCPRGPEHEACDAVEGNAVYDNWLRTPVRDAPEAPHPPGQARGQGSPL